MNIQEIEAALPNGLHDAVLRRYTVDYEKASAVLHFDIWVGDLDSDEEQVRERYRPGTVTFRGLRYFVVEPPGPGGALTLEPFSSDAGDPGADNVNASVSLPEAPHGSIRAYFFLYKMNSFIHVCASEAELELGESKNGTTEPD